MIKISRLIKSFRYSIKGLIKTWREEQNLQIQSIIALLVLFLAFYFRITSIEWALLIFSISLVLTVELINSAVERITDILKPRINGYVKEIKDIMAGAVLLISIMSVVVGFLIFFPYIF
ncbi:diacylglycerol kinase family protein [bacterium]|nr:diacylglycerol kinase family protein [bacterium]